MISLTRIRAIMLQEYYITARSVEVAFDLPFTSIMTTIIFGYFATFLNGQNNPTGALYLLVGLLLWEIVRVNQYSISVSSLWNVWSRNLSNMFITPLSLTEYIIAQMLSGVAKTI